MPTDNSIRVNGNSNVVIQDCNLNNVTVNVIDSTSFVAVLQHWQKATTRPLNVLIVTTTNTALATLNMPELQMLKGYSDEHKQWQPFGDSVGVLEILKEYEQKSGFRVRAFILDFGSEKVDLDVLDMLKLQKRQTVLLCDIAALMFEGNREVAELFDDQEIGGCFVVHTGKELPVLENNVLKTFRSLHNYMERYAERFLELRTDQGFVHIDLRVSDKDTLFRRFTAIATLHLDPLPARMFDDLNDFDDVPINPFR